MDTPVVAAHELTKSYGKARGVTELTFTVGQGEVFGFLGPNGAGKTTTIRLMLDLIRPSTGRMELVRPRRSSPRQRAAGASRLPPGRPPPLRPAHRPASTCATSRRAAGWTAPATARTVAAAARARPRPAGPRALEGESPEGRARPRPDAPPAAARPRRADLRPRSARPAGRLRARARGDRRRTHGVRLLARPLEVQHIADRVGLIREGRLELDRDDRGPSRRGRAPGRGHLRVAAARRRLRAPRRRA